jgi:hypothetical protein
MRVGPPAPLTPASVRRMRPSATAATVKAPTRAIADPLVAHVRPSVILGHLGCPRGCPQVRFLAHDLSGKTLELFPGLEAEVVVQGAARSLVHVERLRLATRAVEGDHELRHDALAVRALLEEPSELAHELCMASGGQIRVDTDLEHPRAELFEALGLCTAVEAKRNAGKHRAAPETQCLLREGRGPGVMAGGGRLGGLAYE